MAWLTRIGIVILVTLSFVNSVIVPTTEDVPSSANSVSFNFASHAAGAIILDYGPPSAKGFYNLLNNDKDKYGISECSEKKFVVIGLSEVT